MRNTWFIIFLLMTVSYSLSAQHKPFQFGFKGGLNLGWFSSVDDNYQNRGSKFGTSWGFAADFYLMENYSLTTGIEVLNVNGAMDYPDGYWPSNSTYILPGTRHRDYKIKYLRVPVLFTMKTNEINKVKYFGQIGIGIGFSLTAKSSDNFTLENGESMESETNNIYDEIRTTRESVLIGAGVEIPIHKSTYTRIGILFDNAIFNILKGNNSINTSIKNNGRNSFIELNASLFF